MRTEIQFLMRIDEQRAEIFSEYSDERSDAAAEGMIDGFKWAMRMTKEGKADYEIAVLAMADEANYVSYGDDTADAYQSGFTCAAMWGADQYDWDNDGWPHYVEGNIWGHPAGRM